MFTGAPNREQYPVITSLNLKTEDKIKITKQLDILDWILWQETWKIESLKHGTK